MANGYEVRIGEPTKSADGKRLMPFVMIFREEQAQESIHDLKPCMSDSSISRQAVIDAIDEIESEVADGDGYQYEKWRQYFCDLPSTDVPERDVGKWLEKEVFPQHENGFELQSCKCSVCGRYDTRPYLYYFDEPRFCSWCGADMKGETDVKG